jgi:ubiquitin-conjugating enzyme E2 G1
MPPEMKFKSEMWHPNVFPDGKVCISILHEGNDVTGYEHEIERWRPIQNVRTIFLSIISLLNDPNPDSAANIDAAKLLRDNKKLYFISPITKVLSVLPIFSKDVNFETKKVL